jgi:hypothetical protein
LADAVARPREDRQKDLLRSALADRINAVLTTGCNFALLLR